MIGIQTEKGARTQNLNLIQGGLAQSERRGFQADACLEVHVILSCPCGRIVTMQQRSLQADTVSFSTVLDLGFHIVLCHNALPPRERR
eukprot:5866890-Amphidinium_carterae.1